jgi:hypothetical protein
VEAPRSCTFLVAGTKWRGLKKNGQLDLGGLEPFKIWGLLVRAFFGEKGSACPPLSVMFRLRVQTFVRSTWLSPRPAIARTSALRLMGASAKTGGVAETAGLLKRIKATLLSM